MPHNVSVILFIQNIILVGMHFASLYLTQKLSFVKSKCDDPKIKI